MILEKEKFCKRTFFFLAPALCCWLAIEIFYRWVPNNYTVKADNLSKNKKETEVLLFGDSHCMYGLNPDYFSRKTCNLSNVSQTIYFDKLLFEKYVPQMPKLKQVVFCIEYTNLSQADNTQDDLFRKYYYSRYMDLDVPSISKWDPGYYSIALSQDFGWTKKLLKRFIKSGSLTDCNDSGWGNNYKKEDRIDPRQVAARRAVIQEDGSLDFRVNLLRLQEMIDRCKERKIEVLIVSMPQTLVFERHLNPQKMRKIITTCTGLARRNTNVHYLNLFRDKRFGEKDFYDADHLNDSGAIKSSIIVNRYLDSISSNKKSGY